MMRNLGGIKKLCFFLLGMVVVMILVMNVNHPFERYLPSVKDMMRNMRPRIKPHIAGEQDIYICAIIRGRSGNAFFFYMSILVIARANNMTLVLRDKSVLPQVLEHPPTSVTQEEFDNKCADAKFVGQRRCCVLDDALMRLPHDDRYLIFNCLISWRYFERMEEREVKRLLTFRKDVLSRARDIVGQVRRSSGNATLVGLHVRRDDMAGWFPYWNGRNPVTPQYTARAMKFFYDRFPHVHFVVASDDTAWCRKYVTRSRNDVTIMEDNSAAVDMAVLTLTEHMIVSIGTFGWWAGYLNPGIKTYMKDFIGSSSDFAENFDDLNAFDYIYHGWVGL